MAATINDADDTFLSGNSVSCKCLNLRFQLSSLIGNNHDGGDESAAVTAAEVDGFGNGEIDSMLLSPKIVRADVAKQANFGASITLDYLMQAKSVKSWDMYSCFNCKTLTHVVSHAKSNLVLVNCGEMLNQSQQDALVTENPNYSELYGIVCLPVKGKPVTLIKSTLKPSVVDLVRDIKERASSYLEDEKSKMRDRIQQFEAAQQAMFEDLERSISTSQSCLENQIWAVFNESTEDADSAYERSVEELSLDRSPSSAVGMYTHVIIDL